MSHAGSVSGATAGAAAPVRRKLSQRHDLAPRVRHLLNGSFGLCTRSLGPALVGAVAEFEQALLQQAGKARSSEQSRRCFDSLRTVKRSRADVAARFLVAIEDALARFDQRRPGAADGAAHADELALVEADDLEETLATQEVATKCEIHNALALHDLGHRFGVLAAQPPCDARSVPLGPAQIMKAVAYACAGMDLPAEHRVLLYRTCDRTLLGGIGAFYASLNTFFTEHRILRHLRVHMPARTRARGSDQTDAASKAHAGVAPANVPDAARRRNVPAGGAGEAGDPELFRTLRALLAGTRPSRGAHPPGAGGGYVPSAEDVQAVLGQLHSGPAGAAARRDASGQRSAAQLKQELLDRLGRIAPPGQNPRLNSEDSDTIELVGMLFDHIAASSPARGNTRSMLGQLQVPLLRVALRDKGFFTHGAHPARLFLNAIAETGIHWIDETGGEADPALLKKMHAIIERLNEEFDGDLSLIERMLGDLSHHMHTLAHKDEVAERRLVEASRGREKLAVARETAGNAIAERIGAARPGRLLRTMLEQAWIDVLALTVLRQGEDSDAYRHQLAVVDQLIAMGRATHASNRAQAALLRQEVERGLGQVGYHPDEIHAVVRHLLAPDAAANDAERASQTEVALGLKSRSHLGETAEEKPLRAAALRRAALRLNAAEEQMLEHLKTVAFGTWFEVSVNQQGDRVRRKLSWYSPMTGRCLFVNQRGQRADDRSLEQLARDIVRGQARIAEVEKESLVDRAWKAILASLRHLGGHPDESPKPA